MKDVLISWLHEYRSVLAYFVVGLVVVLLRSRTPAQWVALGETRPRSQGLIKMLRGAGFDPAKFIEGLTQFLSGRVRPTLATRLSDADRAGIERARNALIAVAAAEQTDEDRAALARINELLGATSAAPSSSSEPGFAERGVLHLIAGVCALALGIALLTGCPLPPADGCTPFATRCSPSGIPETCSQSARWSYAPPAVPCAQRGPVVCCNTRSPWGRELHACTPQSECLPERASDAGAEVSDGR